MIKTTHFFRTLTLSLAIKLLLIGFPALVKSQVEIRETNTPERMIFKKIFSLQEMESQEIRLVLVPGVAQDALKRNS